MIIDSHLHFYDMLAEPPGDVHHDHLPFERVIAEAREIGVGQIVQVTPFAAGYDNRHGFAVAERHPDDVLGVIARIDPLHPDVEQHLRALLEHPKMLALRLTLIEDNEHWLADGTVDDFFGWPNGCRYRWNCSRRSMWRRCTTPSNVSPACAG